MQFVKTPQLVPEILEISSRTKSTAVSVCRSRLNNLELPSPQVRGVALIDTRIWRALWVDEFNFPCRFGTLFKATYQRPRNDMTSKQHSRYLVDGLNQTRRHLCHVLLPERHMKVLLANELRWALCQRLR